MNPNASDAEMNERDDKGRTERDDARPDRDHDRPDRDHDPLADASSDAGAGTRATDRASIDCEEALRHLAAFLDHELDGKESEAVEGHLEACRSCFSRAEFERRLKERIRRDLAVQDVPAELEERVRNLLRSLPEST